MNARTPKKILTVDDDPHNRKLMETLLRAEGYEVRCVSSGKAALDAIATDAPDLILLDLMMPGMDGFEVLRRMKTDPVARRIPVIVVTAVDEASSRARLAAAGIAEVVTKPVDRWELKTRMERLLNKGGTP